MPKEYDFPGTGRSERVLVPPSTQVPTLLERVLAVLLFFDALLGGWLLDVAVVGSLSFHGSDIVSLILSYLVLAAALAGMSILSSELFFGRAWRFYAIRSVEHKAVLSFVIIAFSVLFIIGMGVLLRDDGFRSGLKVSVSFIFLLVLMVLSWIGAAISRKVFRNANIR